MEERLNILEDRQAQERFILRKFYDFLSCTDRYSEQAHGDAIFVFGHTDPRIAQHAGRLWLEGRADKIILTGKGRKQIVGFDTEADFYAGELLKIGVPPEAIILEKESTNTRENIVWGIARCKELGFSPSTLILCAMPPLLRRSCATFEKQFPRIDLACSAPDLFEEFCTIPWIVRMLGEVDRFNEYFEKGDIAHVSISKEIEGAINALHQMVADAQPSARQ